MWEFLGSPEYNSEPDIGKREVFRDVEGYGNGWEENNSYLSIGSGNIGEKL